MLVLCANAVTNDFMAKICMKQNFVDDTLISDK